MNILLLYPKTPWTTAQYCEKSLRKKHHVEVFDLSPMPNLNTILETRAFWREVKGIEIPKILKQCKKEPNIIIEIDGAGSHHLKGYREVMIPKAYWAIDSHIKLNFQKRIAQDFDYVFIAQKDYIESFKEVADNVYWLPLAADPDIHKKFDINKPFFDIGYVGKIISPTERLTERLIDSIVDPLLNLIPGHKKVRLGIKERARLISILSRKYNVLAVNNVWGENLAKVYSLSKIGFNKSIAGDLNMRVFEVMSCGTMLLTNKIENGMSSLFNDRKHLVVYSTEEELVELVQYYLENEEERETIARQGQKKVHDKHTYDHRMDEMLKKLIGAL